MPSFSYYLPAVALFTPFPHIDQVCIIDFQCTDNQSNNCIDIFDFYDFDDPESAAAIEGQWQCMTRSGQYDDHTWYQINCSGDIIFRKNKLVESACKDVFIPTGSMWQTTDRELILSDSDGQEFVRYQLDMPDERTLILERKGVKYTFDRVFAPRPAGG